MERETAIYCSTELLDEWPKRLAPQWRRQYPHLFDADDLRLALAQPRNHFAEWLAAIHILQRDGHFSLIEKYLFRTHPVKAEVVAALLAEPERAALREICRRHRCQPPDLLVYSPAGNLVAFAEVKGPGDRRRARQDAMIAAVGRRLAVPVERIAVRFAES